MARVTYTVLLQPDAEMGGFTVLVPALPGCVTQGDTVDEALAMARDAIVLYLQGEPPTPERDGVKALVATVSVDVESDAWGTPTSDVERAFQPAQTG